MADVNNAKQRILIVEDEIKLASVMQEYLEQSSFIADVLHHGDEVMPWLAAQKPMDLIILDLMLPGTDGITLCEQIRNLYDIPVIMVTARVEERDRLQGFDKGADDYICKPFSLNEMVARVKVVLRRSQRSAANAENSVDAKCNSLFKIEPDKMCISVYNHLLDLTPVEFRLLKHMLDHPLVVFSRNDLLDIIYDDYRLVSDRTIDSHIKNLRKKIQPHFLDQEIIQSVYGVGYKYQLN